MGRNTPIKMRKCEKFLYTQCVTLKNQRNLTLPGRPANRRKVACDKWRFGLGFCIDAKKGVMLGNLQIFVLFDIWGSRLALKVEFCKVNLRF